MAGSAWRRAFARGAAVCASWACLGAAGAQTAPPLDVTTDDAGNIRVNGVVFEADLGASPEEILEYVEIAPVSRSFPTMHDAALVERVYAVLATLGQGRPE
jgi:hypothetical protein